MSLPTTYEVFDLVPTEPVRRSRRPAAQSSGRVGPQFSRPRTAREIREYVYPISTADEHELRRLVDIWNRTRFGTLPMLLEHPEDGQLAVVFDQTELGWRQNSPQDQVIEVSLREWVS